MAGSASAATWTRSGGDFVRGDLRITRSVSRGWKLVLEPRGDPHLALLARGLREGIACASLTEAKRRAEAIEAIHLRRMKLRSSLFVGLPAAFLAVVLPAAITSSIGYVVWVVSLAVAAEALLRACEAGFWDEWGWFGEARSYDAVNRFDWFVDRHLARPSEPAPDDADRLVQVVD